MLPQRSRKQTVKMIKLKSPTLSQNYFQETNCFPIPPLWFQLQQVMEACLPVLSQTKPLCCFISRLYWIFLALYFQSRCCLYQQAALVPTCFFLCHQARHHRGGRGGVSLLNTHAAWPFFPAAFVLAWHTQMGTKSATAAETAAPQ